MQEARLALPHKTREIQNVVCDSTRWNGFPFRDGDVVIATYSKTGTTWTQQIVGQLILGGAETVDLFTVSPWVDFRLIPFESMMETLQAQTHRRFLKTHLSLDALVFHPKVKYLYVARDGRDALWSMYNHHAGFTEEAYKMLNGIPGRIGPPLEPPKGDIVQYFHEWLDNGGEWILGMSFWQHVQDWWNAQDLPNVMLVHFNNLKADMPAEIRRIARFLEVDIDEAKWPAILEHCSIEYMRSSSRATPTGDLLAQVFDEGVKTFFHKGTNGRWKDVLSAAEVERYERAVRENLTPDCAHWLATGQ